MSELQLPEPLPASFSALAAQDSGWGGACTPRSNTHEMLSWVGKGTS